MTFYGGGKTLGSAPVEFGKNTSQAAASGKRPTRTGYTLTGWCDKDGNVLFDAKGYAASGRYWNGSYSPNKSSATWKYAGNVTAYAQWKPNANKNSATANKEEKGSKQSTKTSEPRKTSHVTGQKGGCKLFSPGELVGVFADGKDTFALMLDEGLETAYLVIWAEGGGVTCECEVVIADDTLVLTAHDGETYRLAWDSGTLIATHVE